jgi:uncharacterized protein (TIRG00374 family)
VKNGVSLSGGSFVGQIAKTVITLSLLAWLFLQLDQPAIFSLLGSLDWSHLGLAFVFAFLLTAAMAWRWQVLLRVIQIRVPFREICRISLITNFLADILPSNLGGDVMKVYYVGKLVRQPAAIISSILIDRYLGVLALVIVPLASVPAGWPSNRLGLALGALYIGILALLLLAAAVSPILLKFRTSASRAHSHDRWRGLFRSLRGSFELYARQKWTLVGVLAIGAASQILHTAIYYSLGLSLGEERKFIDFLYLIPAVTLATLLPLSIGGLGVREWTFVSLFTEAGMSMQTAVSISVLNLFLKVATGPIGAILYWAEGSRSRDAGSSD